MLRSVLLASSIAILASLGCSSSQTPGRTHVDIPAAKGEYVVFAWNDLGMHCLNPTYDRAVILPPYNTVWAQVVKRGNPPIVVTAGLTAEYRVIDNTYSYGKTDGHGGAFAQFWDNCQAIFGTTLEHNTGLNIEDPGIRNGLSGQMVLKDDHFQVNGMPVVPVNDSGVWNPYQVVEVTILSGANVVAQIRATVPTSDEINCARCHGQNAFEDVLAEHDRRHGTALAANAPVLCANGSCHTTPALGQTGSGTAGYLSAAIHGAHASRDADCLDCHPGALTKCNRSLAHTNESGNCATCHGSMEQIASGIQAGDRVPWAREPKCSNCHIGIPHVGIPHVDTGAILYRNAKGHGGIYCVSCHGSPHAMVPSREDTDNYQPLHLQNSDKTIGSCGVCHDNSRGEGVEGFGETHGGSGGEPTACGVCHTSLSGDVAEWPHAFLWKAR
jgi:hypothetical protein